MWHGQGQGPRTVCGLGDGRGAFRNLERLEIVLMSALT